MKRIIFIVVSLIVIFSKTDAQVTWNSPGCGQSNPNLQMVVYQGCTPSEGTKEFLHFTTGTSSWNIADLSITGSQNSTIAPFGPCSYAPGDFIGNISATNALNAIAMCPTQLFAVAPATIPPNSKVIVIPNVSGAFAVPPYGGSFTAADIAPLCGKGPIYVIGATANAGCTSGIFSNKNTACPSNCNRNIVISFGGGCTATINYDINDPVLPNVPTAANFTPGCGTGSALPNTTGCFPIPCEIPDISVNIAPNSKLCANSTQNINFTLQTNAPVGSSYSWSGPNGFTSTAASPTVNNPGFSAGNYVYNVTVCVPGGCSKASSVTVTIIDNPLTVTASLDPTSVLCVNATQSIKLMANVTGAPAAITYAWSSNSAPPFSSTMGPNVTHSPSPNLPLGTYTYTVTATSAGCAKSASTSVTVTNGLSFTPQPDITVCGSVAIPLSVTPTPSGTATYVWTGTGLAPTTSATPTATAPLPPASDNALSTNYKVTVTDNGCTWSDDFNIVVFAPPTATITPVPPICKTPTATFGLTVTGTTTGATYSWSGPGFTSSTQNPTGISAASLPAGVNTYTLSVTNGPCVTIVTTSVTIVDTPTFTTITDMTICGTAATPLSVTGTPPPSGAAVYTWQGTGLSATSGATPTATAPLPATPAASLSTNYKVSVTEGGCDWTDDFNIVVFAPATATITPVPPVCKGTPFNLNASGAPTGSTYSWSGPGFTSSVANNPNVSSTTLTAGPNIYTVTITNGPCVTTLTTTVTITDPPSFTPIPDLTVCGQGPFPLAVTGTPPPSGTATYMWVPTAGSGTVSSATSATPMVTPALAMPLLPPYIKVNTYNVTVTEANGCQWVDEFKITTNPPPLKPNVVTPVSVCIGQPIVLTVTSGTLAAPFPPLPITNLPFPAQFSWSGPSGYTSTGSSSTAPYSVTVSPTATTLMAGVYTLTVTAPSISGDLSCASTPENVTVNVQSPTATTYTNANVCKGQTVALNTLIATPTPIPTGTWTGSGVTGSTFNSAALTAGTYSVTFTPGASCVAGGSTDITVSDSPDVTLSQSGTLCGSTPTFTGTVNLDVVTVGGTGYTWSSGVTGTGANVTVNAPGVYKVTVTNATGCSTVKDVTVTAIPNPVVSITAPNILCPGAPTVTLTLNNTFTTYLWNDGSSAPTLGITGPGNYAVTVTNANGCSSVATKNITSGSSLSPTISPASAKICGTGNIVLSVTGSYPQYLWSNSLGTAQTATVSAGGTYTVTVSEPASGCTGVASVNVSQFAAPTVSIAGDLTVCPGKTSVLSTNPNTFSSYSWSSGPTTPTVTASFPLAYTVTVTDANGCTATNSAIFSNFQAPNPFINGDNFVCVGQTKPITVVGGAFPSYKWSNGDMTNTITVGNGIYTVTVTDANSCTATAQKTVNQDVVNVSIIGNSSVCPGKTITLSLSAGFSPIQWSASANNSNTPTVDVSNGVYDVTVTNSNGCTATATKTIAAASSANVSLVAFDEFCQGTGNLITTTPNNFVSYEWQGQGPTPVSSFSPTGTGTYTVIVTDGNGCTATASKNIIMNPSPTPVISGSSTICAGSSTTLDGGAGYSNYLWSTGASGQTIVVNTASLIQLTVTDSKGCKGVAVQNVTSSGSLNFTITGNKVFCEGGFTTLSAGAGFTSYKWNNSSASTTPDITVNEEKTFTVTVSNGACEGTASISVTKSNNVPFTINGKIAFCEGGSESLTVSTDFDKYLWSNNDLNKSITVTKSGTYSVTVTNLAGCTGIQSVNVTVNPNPKITVDGIKSICDGDQTTLSVSPAQTSYKWSNNEITKDIVVKIIDTYSVTATDVNGCTGTAATTISKVSDLKPTIDAKTIFCEGDTLHLTASAGYGGYTWSNGEITAAIIINKGGTYVVTVNNGACKGVDSVTIKMNLKPVIIISKDTAVCEGNEVALIANAGAAIYQWSNKENKPIINVSTSGNYIVTVTTAEGCFSIDSVKLTVNPLPKPSIIAPSTICIGETATLSLTEKYDKYLWSNNKTSDTIQVNTPGTYIVTVTTLEGCSAIISKKIDIQNSLTPKILGKARICDGESTNLTIDAPYTNYTWSGGEITNNITVNSASIYSVTVSTASGCSGTGSITVEKAPTPTPKITGLAIICGTNPTTLVASGGSSYEWSNGIKTASATFTTSGKYDVTVTNSDGCKASTSVDVKETNVTGSLQDTLCKGGFVQINGKRYDELNPSGTETLLKAASGGCDSVLSIQLYFRPAISVSLIGGKTLCGTGSSVDLSIVVSGYNGTFDLTYEDDFGVKQTINAVKDGDIFSVTPSKTTNYTISSSIQNGKCGVTYTGTKVVISSVSFTSKTQNIICNGEKNGAIFITPSTGIPPFDYKWDNNINSSDNQRLSAGKYTVTVNDASGCTAIDSFNITEPKAIKGTLTSESASCVGSKGKIIISNLEGGAGDYTYSFDGKNFSQVGALPFTIKDVAIGDYTLTINDLNKCSWSDKVTVPSGNALKVDLGLDLTLVYGDSVVLTPKTNFQMTKIRWTPKAYLSCDTCQFVIAKPKATTNYKVTVWDAFGCVVTDDIQLIINKIRRVFIPTAFSPGNGDGNNDLFRIYLGDETVKVNSFRVYDRWGTLVYEDLNFTRAESQDVNRGWDGFYKGDRVNPGVFVYHAQVEFTDGEVKEYVGDVLLMKQP